MTNPIPMYRDPVLQAMYEYNQRPEVVAARDKAWKEYVETCGVEPFDPTDPKQVEAAEKVTLMIRQKMLEPGYREKLYKFRTDMALYHFQYGKLPDDMAERMKEALGSIISPGNSDSNMCQQEHECMRCC